MCRFKSGLITKNNVVLTPMYNESHSRLLESKSIEDSDFNARKVFVCAELIPIDGDLTSDVDEWKYIVDQDVTPDWYEEDPDRYEGEFRKAVKSWVKENIVVICDEPCTVLKKDGNKTYYHLCNSLFRSDFGETNDWRKSYIKDKLNESDFAKKLREQFGENLVTTDVNLISLDGLKDYGTVSKDILSLMDLDLYRECRENIFVGDKWWWLATPNSTPFGIGSSDVRCVDDDGGVRWSYAGGVGSVRPFFIIES